MNRANGSTYGLSLNRPTNPIYCLSQNFDAERVDWLRREMTDQLGHKCHIIIKKTHDFVQFFSMTLSSPNKKKTQNEAVQVKTGQQMFLL